MAHLTKMSADVVKIDKAFIQSLDRDVQGRFLMQQAGTAGGLSLYAATCARRSRYTKYRLRP